MFGQATGAIHVSIVDLILPETPCFPFEAFQVKRFLQTLRTNAFLDLSCDSDRMLDLLSSVLKNSQSFGILEFAPALPTLESTVQRLYFPDLKTKTPPSSSEHRK